METLATLSPFLHMLHGSYPQRRRSIAHETLDLMPADILLDTRKLELELQSEDVRSMLKDSTCNQVSRLTYDAFRSTKLLKQIHLEQLAENSDMREGFAYIVHAIAAVKSLYFLGLEKSIGDLKSPYFQNEVPVFGISCMGVLGGVGKNTLASDLCNDFNIKGCFQILLVIALSESPYVQGLIKMMWGGIVGWRRSEFRNVEDACMQVQIHLPRQSNSTPLIFNHVGFRGNMEKLQSQVGGYKTLLTDRHRSIIPRNYPIQFYQLSLLGQGDALSLFCLHRKPCDVWEIAKTKLANGELVSDYHLDGLLRFFDTSIRFPVDKKTCTDALLYIWVYARRLEWLEAFTTLQELASINLLNLISEYWSTAATLYANAAELYFSQYHAMREFQRNRVACSWKGGYFAWR